MKFRGKVAWWFYAVMVLVALVLVPIITLALRQNNVVALAVCLLVFFSVEIFCLGVAVHNYVILGERALLIVFGFMKRKIPYSKIVALKKTRDPSSSLAASLNRIKIELRGGESLMISVVEEKRFLSLIRERDPGIIVRLD